MISCLCGFWFSRKLKEPNDAHRSCGEVGAPLYCLARSYETKDSSSRPP